MFQMCAIPLKSHQFNCSRASSHPGHRFKHRAIRANPARRKRMSDQWNILMNGLSSFSTGSRTRASPASPSTGPRSATPEPGAVPRPPESLDIIRADKAQGRHHAGRRSALFLGLILPSCVGCRTAQCSTGTAPTSLSRLPRTSVPSAHHDRAGCTLPGGALGIMNCHDIVFSAEDAQLGMRSKCCAARSGSPSPRR